MPGIEINGITKVFPNGVKALDSLDLSINDGEFFALLGPSGCGKTTLLRTIAGLEAATSGQILIGERDVTPLAPGARNLAMVFQDYALYPHMTVRDNIAYPLKVKGVHRGQRGTEAESAGAHLSLSQLMERRPGQLSGGQQQRVALARAIATRPDAFLFDEPLSNLDARLRLEARTFLKRLQHDLTTTAVFVTHDQSEALALADRVAIMRSGRFEQVGTPEHVFEEPATEYVAGFIGMSNRLPMTHDGSSWSFSEDEVSGDLRLADGRQQVTVRLRPDDLRLSPRATDVPPGHASFPANVVDSQFGGRHMDVVVRAGDTRLEAQVPSGAFGGWARKLEADEPVVVAFDPGSAVYYDDDGQRIAGHVPVATADTPAESVGAATS